MNTLLLNEQQIKGLLTMKEAIDICDRTFADLALGNTLNPAKVNLNLGDSEPTKLPYKASLNAMPAYIGWQDVAGMKWAGGFGKGRIEIGRPFLNALILLIQPNYGDFQAVMDGSWIMPCVPAHRALSACVICGPGRRTAPSASSAADCRAVPRRWLWPANITLTS